MMRFADRFKEYCAKKGTSPYKVAVETGVDSTLVSNWMNDKREPKPATAMEALRRFSESPNLGISFEMLAAWWAMEHIPREAFKEGFKELYESDPTLEMKVQSLKGHQHGQ